MNTIKVVIPFDKNEFLQAFWIRLKIQMNKINRYIVYHIIAAIVFLGIGIFYKTTVANRNPEFVIGIFFGSLALLLIAVKVTIFILYKTRIKHKAERLEALNMDCVYEFTEDWVKYSDKEKTLEYKWKVFSYYTIYKNNLVMVRSASPVNYVFNQKNIGADNYAKLVEMAEAKLNFKKYKIF